MRNNAAYLPESPIVYIILPKSIRNRASFRIFAQFTCKGGHRQQAGHRLRAVWSDAGMKATFALPMNSSVDIVIFFKGDFSLQKTDVS